MIAHAPIFSIVRMSRTQRLRCASVPFALIAAAVSPTDTPIAVTMPGEHLHSSMIGISVKPAPPPPPSPRVCGVPASSAAMRLSKPSAAIWSIPNVLYSLRRRSYGGMSPCSSSSRCGRISLSTNWRTASRTIWSSSGHSNMAGSYATAAFRLAFACSARTQWSGFSRVPGRSMHSSRDWGPGSWVWGGMGWIPTASACGAHCLSMARSWVTCCCACAATRPRRSCAGRWATGAPPKSTCASRRPGRTGPPPHACGTQTGLAMTAATLRLVATGPDEVCMTLEPASGPGDGGSRPGRGRRVRRRAALARDARGHHAPWLNVTPDPSQRSSSRRTDAECPKCASPKMGMHCSGRPPRSPRGGRPEPGAPAENPLADCASAVWTVSRCDRAAGAASRP